ncbi:MAG: glycosyltransferase family 4 protein [Acidobacteria bacterium]|nr:glycosyltransferase family 4 protein [Acidobacteriota bacterium]
MKIGIFVMTVGLESGGPGTYELELIRSLIKRDRENEYHVFCLNRAKNALDIKADNLRYHYIKPDVRWISLPTTLPYLIMRSKVQILHATFIPPPISPKKYVFTMHCSSHFVHPEFYDSKILWRLNRFLDLGMKRASVVLCVSNHVRDLVSEKYRVPKDRLPVVYHGVDARFRPIPRDIAKRRIEKEFGIREPYILYVGKLTARKNIIRILEAYNRFHNEVSGEVKLVLAGRRTMKPEGIGEAIDRLRLKDRVIELGYLSHEALPDLYSAAEMFLFPSLWEGFGIPIIESMACGTPVVTSDNSCMPEIAGGAALHVNPYSVDDIVEAMRKIHSDTALRQRLTHAGIRRAAGFSWEKAAEQSLEVYKAAVA